MTRGDIFIANNDFRTPETARHPIIFWGEHDADSFIGLMITHGVPEKFPDNILFNEDKFYSQKFGDFSDTHVVGQALIKKNEWRDNIGKQIGKLTNEGIEFIKQNIIDKTKPKWWSEYNV